MIPKLVNAQTINFLLLDICNSSILAGSIFCKRCGLDLCLDCFDRVERKELGLEGELLNRENPEGLSHYFPGCQGARTAHSLCGMTRFEKGVLESVFREIEGLPTSATNIIDQPTSQTVKISRLLDETVSPYRKVPVLQAEDDAAFSLVWRAGLPVVVRAKVSGTWTPQRLVELHGQKVVKVQRTYGQLGTKHTTKETTIENFMSTFDKSPEGDTKYTDQLRVNIPLSVGYASKLTTDLSKDYPPSESFKDSLAPLATDFQYSLPYPTKTRENGMENLAAHWPYVPQEGAHPEEAKLRPDLGKYCCALSLWPR